METDRIPLASTVASRPWKLWYAATPKGGCTSILTALARLLEVDEAGFRATPYPEVTRSMTVHDLARWREGIDPRQWAADELAEVEPDDGWLLFTVTRHPLSRVWSAWQSKLLLREPYFVAHFGAQAWFPALPTTPEAVLEDFRRFALALRDPAVLNADRHWMLQSEVLAVDDVPYNHVGRLDQLGETVQRVEEHLRGIARRPVPFEVPRANRSLLPFPVEALGAEVLDALQDVYARDFDRFGYDPLPVSGSGPADAAGVAALLPAISEIVARHERIGDMATTTARLRAVADEDAGRLASALREVAKLTARVADLQGEVDAYAEAAAVARRQAQAREEQLATMSAERLAEAEAHRREVEVEVEVAVARAVDAQAAAHRRELEAAAARAAEAEAALDRWLSGKAARALMPLLQTYARLRAKYGLDA